MRDLGTSQLLGLWHRGDTGALDALLIKHEAWIRRRVSRRLGGKLRLKLDSTDILQETFLRFLKDGPRLQVENERTFRALMVVIVENTIRDTHSWFTRRRRDMARDQELPDETVIHLDSSDGVAADPPEIVSRAEQQARVRLGLELLDPDDREILLLRTRDGLSFPEIGKRLGIQSGAADTRCRRAAAKLATATRQIRANDSEGLLAGFRLDDD